MRALTVGVRESTGRVLSCTIFRTGGRKLLAKGHVLSQEDVRLLVTEGLDQVWVTELEDGEVGEDEAVRQASAEMGCGALDIRMAPGGRANLFATEDCCVLVDEDLLRQLNCTSSLAVATVANFTYARAEQRVATVKSAPFAVPGSQLEAVLAILRERGPILQCRPVRNASVAVLYTDPIHGDRARHLFECVVLQKLDRVHAPLSQTVSVVEDEAGVTQGLQQLLRANPAGILVASTSAPAGPDDIVGRAMTRIGCRIERFLAPVEPGNLFLLAYRDEVPVVSAPGCYRSAKPNVIDLILPPLLARYRLSGWEVGCLGHGGLLG